MYDINYTYIDVIFSQQVIEYKYHRHTAQIGKEKFIIGRARRSKPDNGGLFDELYYILLLFYADVPMALTIFTE